MPVREVASVLDVGMVRIDLRVLEAREFGRDVLVGRVRRSRPSNRNERGTVDGEVDRLTHVHVGEEGSFVVQRQIVEGRSGIREPLLEAPRRRRALRAVEIPQLGLLSRRQVDAVIRHT
jgi:hypothetical protein